MTDKKGLADTLRLSARPFLILHDKIFTYIKFESLQVFSSLCVIKYI